MKEGLINANWITFEIDTGAAVSILTEKMFSQIRCGKLLQFTISSLYTVNGQVLQVKGQVKLNCKFHDKEYALILMS